MMADDAHSAEEEQVGVGALLPVLAPANGMLVVLHEDLERAAEFKKAARAAATHRAYASDWKIYEAWCSARGLQPMPAHPEQIAAFVANQVHAGAKPSTVERRGCGDQPSSPGEQPARARFSP